MDDLLIVTVYVIVDETLARDCPNAKADETRPAFVSLKTLGRTKALSAVPILVYVASAGNFGNQTNAYTPASWPEVLSVSASSFSAPNSLATYSNKGDVMAFDGWFPVDATYVANGTSFAAPLVSRAIAYALATGQNCPFANVRTHNYLNKFYLDAFSACLN